MADVDKLPRDEGLIDVSHAATRWAHRFGGTHLGTEHVVLGLAEVDGPAKTVLAEAGLTLEKLRDAIVASLPESKKKLFAPTPEEALRELGVDLRPLQEEASKEFGIRLTVGHGLNLTTSLTVAFSLAEQQAERLGNSETTAEHLLLALLWQGDPWVTGLRSSMSVATMRRRLLDEMALPAATRTRYIRECERSERVAANTRSRNRSSATWITESATEDQIAEILSRSGQAAVSGRQMLDRVLKAAMNARLEVVDNANRAAPTFWVEVNRRLRQLFVATAVPGDGGDVKAVGVGNPARVPAWVDARYWPGFPSRKPRSDAGQ